MKSLNRKVRSGAEERETESEGERRRRTSPRAFASFLCCLSVLRVTAVAALRFRLFSVGGRGAVLAGLLLAGAGCFDSAHLAKERLDFHISPEVRFADRHVILLIVDGLRGDVLDRELAAGRLPNIERYLVRRGVRARRAVSSLLTCTYPDIAATLTGFFPGHSGVPSMTFFDRATLLGRRYDSPGRMGRVREDLEQPTLFERLAPWPTVCILTQVSGGATYFVENFQTAGLAYFFGQWRWMDYLSMVRFRLVAHRARRWGEYPRLVVTYLPAVDYAAYHYGVGSRVYLERLHHVDFLVGLLITTLREEGVLDRFALILTADHGHIPTRPHSYVDLRAYLDRDLGIPTTSDSAGDNRSWAERWQRFGPYPAVLMDAGNRSAMLYLRSFAALTPTLSQREREKGEGPSPAHSWVPRPTLEELRRYPTRGGSPVDVIEGLLRREEIQLVVARTGPDAVAVFSRRGEVLIRRQRPARPGDDLLYSYSVLAGEDPLRYTDAGGLKSLVGTGFHPGRQWLRLSLDTPYPDFVPQVVELFDGPRVGDVVLFAREGWSFHPGHASDHGGPLAGELFIPLLVAGPDIGTGELEVVRQVDVAATILEYLGRKVSPGEMDGRSFLAEILKPLDAAEAAVKESSLPE